jgi:hypothetical protein
MESVRPGGDMGPTVEYITAESSRGRQALADIAQEPGELDLNDAPPEWPLARVVGGEPVSLIQVDPRRQMQFPGGSLPYAFMTYAATPVDRRLQGHFRAAMAEMSARLCAAGSSLLLTHGRWALYKALGFSVFTYHSGVFVTVDKIRHALGHGEVAAADVITLHDRVFVLPELLVVSQVRASAEADCLLALRQAADAAERLGKTHVLFEEPAAPSYGSEYRPHATPITLFSRIASSIGAWHTVRGGEPEGDPVPDADAIMVLDTAALLRQALPLLAHRRPLPVAAVAFANDAGAATLVSDGDSVGVTAGVAPGAAAASWPSGALAQLVTGYRSATLLDELCGARLPSAALALLEALFPTCWRLSRDESWTYGH